MDRYKKDKEESFKKRVLGEKSLTKYQREQMRAKLQKERDDWDFEHIGNFKLSYPVLNDPVNIIKLYFNRKNKKDLIFTLNKLKTFGQSLLQG